MKSKFFAFTVCIAFILVVACNKQSTQLAGYIPKDASVVFTIDLKIISDKIKSSGISVDSLVNIFIKEDADAKSKWNDIKNSGIDLNKTVYIFAKQNNSIENGNSQNVALIAEVNDAKKLEAFLKSQQPNGAVSSANNFKYISFGKNSVAGFTDKVLIISVADQTGNSSGESALALQQLQTLFSQKENASIASVSGFKNAISKNGDIHFYTNSANSLNGVAIPGSSKIDELLKDSYTEGVISFEKGKMSGSSETHYNKTLGNIIDKYPSKEIDEDMIKKYPGTISGFGVISFNPKVLVDLLSYLGFDMIANGFTQDLGFTTNDIVNAFSGDIAVMFSPRSMNNTKEFTPPNPGFLMNMKIGDKAAFDKLLNGLLNKQLLTKHGNEYQLGLAGGHGFVIETDNAAVYISSSDEMIKVYQSTGNKSGLPADIEKKINNKSMAVYVDINNLLSNKSVQDSSTDIHLNDTYYSVNISQAAKATFKNFIATTDVNNNDVFKSVFELNFVNQNENSLAAFTQFAAVAYQAEKNRKAGWTAYPPLSNLHSNDSSNENDTDINK